MSQIEGVLEKLEGTFVYDILIKMEEAYENIEAKQKKWREESNFSCADGCGKCCERFEPDLLDCEALYMAAWLIENQRENAEKIADGKFPFNYNDEACPFFNIDTKYHCSIYGGRAFICRLFGASGYYDKNKKLVWRPCKFYPADALALMEPPLEHRQYSEEETIAAIKSMPPAMSDLMDTSLAVSQNSQETDLIREILPKTIKLILWLISMNDNNNPNGEPNSPLAA